MAWQLIYTSAPRLLEAGRSGFGSVARHRAIPPLLVAALERISQFSRLPGLDAERVIFAYRIITAGGGRFHVLSCIRDAGADYTGRTNHLAHHLVAEPREIAALGTHGASPADVLLAMPWCETWTELPRWLEASEEFALSSVAPQIGADAAWWTSVTGNASHAWLLARGEASRSANLLTPPGCDLRPLYAESLRLTPERLWQMPFTTALQPSDDPADFRWLGLEARSQGAVALPSQRPTLDLGAPETLPILEVPAAPAPQPVPGRPAKPVAGPARPVATPRVVAAAKPTPAAPRPRPAEKPFSSAPSAPSAPAPRWPWLAAAAAVLLMAGGAFVVHRQGQQIETERDQTLALIDRLRPLELSQETKLRDEIDKLTTREQLEASRRLLTAAGSGEGVMNATGDAGLQDLRTVLRQIAEARATKEAAEQARKLASTATPAPKPIAPATTPKTEPAPQKSQSTESTVAYFVESKEKLPGLPIAGLRPELNFELRVNGEVIRLGFKSGSILRRNAQSNNGGFQINGQTLMAEPGTPPGPFVLAARAGDAPDLFRIYVGVPEQTSALFGDAKAHLAEEGDSWRISGEFPNPVLEPGAALLLVSTKPLGPEGQPLQLACDAELRCTLDPAIAALRTLIKKRQKEASDLGKHAAEAESGANSIESLRKAVQSDMQILKSDEARKGLNFSASSGAQLVGEFGMALVTDWRRLVSEKGDTQRFEALEKLYEQSKKLAEASNNSDQAKSEMQNLRRVIISSDKSLKTNPFADGLSRLRQLNDRLAPLLGETGALEQAVAKNREMAEQKEREAKALETSPLLAGKIPPDDYTLTVRFGSGRVIKLCTVSVPETAAK